MCVYAHLSSGEFTNLQVGIVELKLVPMAGIELATFALRMRCSTN